MIAIVFWLSAGLIVYAYLGFPLLLLVRARIRGDAGAVASARIEPRLSLVVVAHNEAATIEAKIENLYNLDYPADRLEVIVASDGSSDGTDDLVLRHARPGLRLVTLPRSGKIPALNAAVRNARGEILVFSDANSMFDRDALRELVAPFADPAVGAVGGNQRYVPAAAEHMAGLGERLYWRYDRMLKTAQSRAGSMTAATGAIHAIRRELFAPVPVGVSDDFMTSTRAIAHGYRLVFAPAAVAWETVAPSKEAEFARKLRIIVRGLRGLWIARGLFNPLRHGFYALQIFSHKLLRWSVGWLLIALLASSLLLYGHGALYRAAVLAQAAGYAAALLGLAWHQRRPTPSRLEKVFAIPFYFCMANYAALRAWIQVLGGRRVDTWESTRGATPSPAVAPPRGRAS